MTLAWLRQRATRHVCTLSGLETAIVFTLECCSLFATILPCSYVCKALYPIAQPLVSALVLLSTRAPLV